MLTVLMLIVLVLSLRKPKEIKAYEVEAAHLQSIFADIPDAIVVTGTDGKVARINRGMELLFGYSVNDLAGKSTSIFHESNEDYEQQVKIRLSLDGMGEFKPQEINCRRKDGSVFLGETISKSVKSADGKSLGFVAVIKDISERKKGEEKLELAASLFINAREAIVIADKDACVINVNNAFTQMTEYSREEMIGKDSSLLWSGKHSVAFHSERRRLILSTGHWDGEQWVRRKNGENIAIHRSVDAVYDENGTIKNYVTMFSDITAMKKDQEQLKLSAHYDSLTSLPNRVALADRLDQAMVRCEKHQQSVAVVFLDLDGFKVVNDRYGHAMGDKLLVALSHRMREALREGDILSRFGGDEFVAILTDLAKISDCERVLERLLKSAATPVSVDDIVMQVSASMGITFYPQDGVDTEQLIRHADQAMYAAKQGGKNRYSFFDTAQDKAVTAQKESLSNIQLALEGQEFVLHYQPKVNMRSGDVIGVEALIRWQHATCGLVPPLNFLPATEGQAVSLDIGEWVIDTALAQISKWQSMGIHLPVSVNISAYQLQQTNFVTRLAKLLAAHREVNPRHLELEVLETGALSDFSEVAETMNACHQLGVEFALDDFGTGYSSLTYLRRLPAHLIKIDQSFVRDMLDDADDMAIVEGVIGLARTFKRDVIAEGVETIEHGAVLLKLGCELAQGYGIARPMPADDVPAWIRDWTPDISWDT